MTATYLKGSFLPAVCSHLLANIPRAPLCEQSLKKEKSKAARRKGKKVFKINVNLFASHLFPFST
jgi:hypothetical protein